MLSLMHTNSHLLYQFVFNRTIWVSFVGADGFAGTTGSSLTGRIQLQLDFFDENKKYYTARWFEIRL
jgi:hypothetical protein